MMITKGFDGVNIVAVCTLALLGTSKTRDTARATLDRYRLPDTALCADPMPVRVIVANLPADVVETLAHLPVPDDLGTADGVHAGALRKAAEVVAAAEVEHANRAALDGANR